jgi:hypothetical protein
VSLAAPQKELNAMRESSQLYRAVQKSGEDVVLEILAEPAPGASDHTAAAALCASAA